MGGLGNFSRDIQREAYRLTYSARPNTVRIVIDRILHRPDHPTDQRGGGTALISSPERR